VPEKDHPKGISAVPLMKSASPNAALIAGISAQAAPELGFV